MIHRYNRHILYTVSIGLITFHCHVFHSYKKQISVSECFVLGLGCKDEMQEFSHNYIIISTNHQQLLLVSNCGC